MGTKLTSAEERMLNKVNRARCFPLPFERWKIGSRHLFLIKVIVTVLVFHIHHHARCQCLLFKLILIKVGILQIRSPLCIFLLMR
jgi:hypothetical protein